MRQAKLGASYKVKAFIGKVIASTPDLSVAVIEDAEKIYCSILKSGVI
jgi:hypothetical protein